MTYRDRYIPYRDPRPPYITDDEAQRLRDLWRPSIQEMWQPHSRYDDTSRKIVHREPDFDSTQVSLSMDFPMYVIPPAIAKPLADYLDQQAEGPMFSDYPSKELATLWSAKEFMKRFIWTRRHAQPDLRAVHANFDEKGNPSQYLQSGSDPHPKASVPAPLLERSIDYEEAIVRHVVETDPEYGTMIFTRDYPQRQQREGTLGWTVPFIDKEIGFFSRSILRAKNHLIDVHWYEVPPELLSLNFRRPQLTVEGEKMLDEKIRELEHLIPSGTDYTELYKYHDRVAGYEYPRDKWHDTQETNAQAYNR